MTPSRREHAHVTHPKRATRSEGWLVRPYRAFIFLFGFLLTLRSFDFMSYQLLDGRYARHESLPVTRIDLNHCDRTELLLLPEVGPQLADRIVAYRDEFGPLRTPTELLQIQGIGPATLRILAPYLEWSSDQ